MDDPITADRKSFDSLVYAQLTDAIQELHRRQKDPELKAKVRKLLPAGIPELMNDKMNIAIFRHVATSNYEIRRFMSAADALEEHNTLILEYTADKFTNRNESKYFLGRICLNKGLNKKGESMFECQNIVDFNSSNSTPIKDVKTLWGQSLVDFHHELFENVFPKFKANVVDISDWLKHHGSTAKEYYKAFLLLFVRDGILFENFLLDGKELAFTKEIIMPCIKEITEELGVKPLIVALSPTEIEVDKFWFSHPYTDKDFISRRVDAK
mgnify:CR=1 FL=1